MKLVNPIRPPKKWWDNTVARMVERSRSTRSGDPAALAGWLWYHGMKPQTRKRILAESEGSMSRRRKRNPIETP